MRYILITCILFLQFAHSFTAAAEVALPAKDVDHNKKAASLYSNDLFHDHAAENVRTIQFTCIVFNARDHRGSEGLLMVDELTDNVGNNLRKRINDAAVAHWTPLIRLLLFPKHYFW